jgi:hypothetical protein
MSRTQLRHSSVDNSPMVISWRSRETDPSLTPTRDGSVFTTRFRFASAFDRRGDALGNGRKLTYVWFLSLPRTHFISRASYLLHAEKKTFRTASFGRSATKTPVSRTRQKRDKKKRPPPALGPDDDDLERLFDDRRHRRSK